MIWILYVLLSVVFGVSRDLFQKHVLSSEKASEYLGVRGVFITLISLVLFFPWIDFSVGFTPLGFSVVSGLVLSVGAVFKNKGLKNLEISHVEPLFNLNALFVALLAIVFLGERLGVFQYLGVFLIILGAYVLEMHGHGHGLLKPFESLFGSSYLVDLVFGLFVISVAVILDKFILDSFSISVFTYLFFVYLSMTLFLLFFDFVEFGFGEVLGVLSSDWEEVFWPSLFTVLVMVTYYKAVSLAYATVVIALFKVQSLLATVAGGVFFSEEGLVKKVLGCVLTLLGAVVIIVF